QHPRGVHLGNTSVPALVQPAVAASWLRRAAGEIPIKQKSGTSATSTVGGEALTYHLKLILPPVGLAGITGPKCGVVVSTWLVGSYHGSMEHPRASPPAVAVLFLGFPKDPGPDHVLTKRAGASMRGRGNYRRRQAW